MEIKCRRKFFGPKRDEGIRELRRSCTKKSCVSYTDHPVGRIVKSPRTRRALRARRFECLLHGMIFFFRNTVPRIHCGSATCALRTGGVRGLCLYSLVLSERVVCDIWWHLSALVCEFRCERVSESLCSPPSPHYYGSIGGESWNGFW